jgi:hypothetical protein
MQSVIGQVVLIQAALLVFAVCGTTLFLLLRSLWTRHAEGKQIEYNNKLVDLLFDPPTLENKARAEMPNIWFWQEHLYRDVILNQIRIIAGHEREVLIALYVRSGFLAEDAILLRSRVWWRRLTALIRLDTLSLPQSRQWLLEAMNDRHLLVAMCATRAISRMAGELDPALIFSALERVGQQRREAMIEIITNIGSQLGPQPVIRYLESASESELAIPCIRVLGDLRATEAMPVFLQILGCAELFTAELLSELLDAVRKVADPEAVALTRELLKHSSPLVRAKSIHLLRELGDQEADEELMKLEVSDADVEVQRAFKKTSALRWVV